MNAVSDSTPQDSGTVPPTRVEPPSDPLLGRTLDGRFVPRSLLGQGGMGRVYLAEDLRLKRRVALKLMDVALSRDAEFSQRFKREAVVQAQAAHPGIVQVLDAGDCDEGAYMVLEYSEGRSLSSLLKVGPLRRDRAMEFVEQLLEILDFAHRQGIVHRDLKPGNILIEERGGREIVRVLDFGIAKLLQTERQDEGLTLTKPGFGFGTPGYMSLEQATGQPTDHRTDLYAAGVILYQMLGGVLPYKAAGISDYLVKLASVDIEPLGTRLPALGIPPELDEILLKALARFPDARYASALAFREALREFRRTDIGQGATAIVGKDYSGIGFAIPSNTARQVSGAILESGYVERGYLGMALRTSGPGGFGVLVEAVEPKSPAALAGIRRGDVVVSFDGEPVAEPAGLVLQLTRAPIGATVDIEIVRDGRPQTVAVPVGRRPR